MRADRPSARRLLAVTLSAAVVTASAVALARDWSAGMLRGTVLIIEGSEWREVEAGAVVSRESAIRTLQSGRVELGSGGDILRIGPRTTFELFTNPGEDTTLVRQYSGSVVVEAGGAPSGLTVEAFDYVVVPVWGTLTIEIADGTATISVNEGNAAVTDRLSGQTVAVATGDQFVGSPAGGAVIPSAPTPPENASSGAPGSSGAEAGSGASSGGTSGGEASSGDSSGGASSGGSASSGGGSSGGSGGGSSSSEGASSSGNSASSSGNNASSNGNNASSGGNNASSGGNNASGGGKNGSSTGGSLDADGGSGS